VAPDRTAFTCRCGAQITDFLEAALEAAPTLSVGAWVVAPGAFLRAAHALTYAEFVTCGSPSRYRGEDSERLAIAAGDVLVHPDGACFTMAAGASHGCCGWQPRGEPNVLCTDGHPIGTLHADVCWSPLVLRLHHASVEGLTLS
jgi:hypothetical protein